jgi:hypothetical protein
LSLGKARSVASLNKALAATAFEFLKRVRSSTAALKARLTNGPTPDMVVSLLQMSSFRDLREMPIELHVLPAWRSF